jgi:hypothetical protein
MARDSSKFGYWPVSFAKYDHLAFSGFSDIFSEMGFSFIQIDYRHEVVYFWYGTSQPSVRGA